MTPSTAPAPPPPRWVKMFGLVAIILVIAFVIAHLARGGMHGH